MKTGMKAGNKWLKARIILVLCLFIFSFGAIFLKAFSLQVIDGKALRQRAAAQHERVITIPSKRGNILDRNLEEMAVSIEVDSVFARPRDVNDPWTTAAALSPVLAADSAFLKKRFSSDMPFVWLERQVDLSPKERKFVTGLNGIGVIKENRRFYPSRSLGANLIGFAGVDSNGLEGVERAYDDLLKGISVTVRVEKDAGGNILLFDDPHDGAKGMDVRLTIDKNIQHIAEKALRAAVERFGAKAGSAIVMDPMTGEILAMTNFPTFDPNDFTRFMPHDWRNRAITDIHEPGSTIKAFLLAAAFEEGAVEEKDIIYCELGSYRVLDRVFHDTKKYGWLTVEDIVKHSSNIGAVKIAERLGKRSLYMHLKAFGFGEKTGIDLPGEAFGSLNQYARWSPVQRSTIAFGQGLSSTTLQIANAFSALANGGFLMKPYVVKEIRDSNDASIVSEFNPIVIRRAVSKQTAQRVARVLEKVTQQGGTGQLAALGGDFTVAGKTGTAQKPDMKKGGYEPGKYMVSFAGFVPSDAPRLTIAVVIDEPEGGLYAGAVAAPVFKEIAKESLAYLGVFPEGNFLRETRPAKVIQAKANIPSPDPHFVWVPPLPRGERGKKYDSSLVPDFRGKTMRGALAAARELNIEVDVRGSGIVIAQTPMPGGGIPREQAVRLVLE